MPQVTEVLADFDGFAVKYDTGENPFFRPIIVENLRKLSEVEAGKSLLAKIAEARPRSRSDFPPGINVMCIPTHINFTQSGFKRETMYDADGNAQVTGMTATEDARFAPAECPFWMAGGSANRAVDQSAANDGTGTVCEMRFSNVQVMTRKGEKADPYIVLAHELVHSFHALSGTRLDGKDEERRATGIGTFADEALSENVFRQQFKMPPRNAYF
ncbi:MAG: hypothetical protein KDB27_10985 [Planctomycetales bacterium]|nr:hypothetical protein [Planctomycetales bacterium]